MARDPFAAYIYPQEQAWPGILSILVARSLQPSFANILACKPDLPHDDPHGICAMLCAGALYASGCGMDRRWHTRSPTTWHYVVVCFPYTLGHSHNAGVLSWPPISG